MYLASLVLFGTAVLLAFPVVTENIRHTPLNMQRSCFSVQGRAIFVSSRSLVFIATSWCFFFVFLYSLDSLECVLERESAGKVFSLWFQIVNKLCDCSLASRATCPASELEGADRT